MLGIGATLGAALALASGFLAWRHWSAATVFDQTDVASRFGVVVGAEGRLTPSAVTGLGAGTVLLLTSGLNLALGLSLD